VTCLSVCPSPGHGVVGFHSDLPVWLPFGLWHCDTTEFPPSVSKREPSLLGSGWDSFPGIPDSRGFRVWDSLPGDPWIPSLGFIAGDPLGSQTPVDSESGPWIPSLGFNACSRGFRVWDTPAIQFKSSSGYTAVELSLFTSIKISTTKLQNTRLKLTEPFRLQIQFWKLIQFFSWLICTDLLLVQSIWLSNEAYIHFCWCVAWSIIDTELAPTQYDSIQCHSFEIALNTVAKWVFWNFCDF
jgi:hypothetical protein